MMTLTDRNRSLAVQGGQTLTGIAAARAELEGFVKLRDRIGLEFVEHCGGWSIIVVPESHEIQPWGAPRFSELARYRGRTTPLDPASGL